MRRISGKNLDYIQPEEDEAWEYELINKKILVSIDSADLRKFKEEVNEFCRQGWEPIGGITVLPKESVYGDDVVICQSLRRKIKA